MHDVIRQRAAASQFLIHEPRAQMNRRFALIRRVEANHLAQVARIEPRLHFEQRRAEAHRERRHQLHARFLAGLQHRL